MSSIAPFAALARADFANIARDPLLAGGAVMSLLPALLLAFFGHALETFGIDQFGYAGFARAASAFALMLPPALLGWIFGFLLIEDRDDGVLLALEITPLGKTGFIAYRLAAALCLTLIVLFASLPLILPDESPAFVLAVALVAGMHAMTTCLFLVGFAANKVEGLALTKLVNIAMLAPLLSLAPAPWRWIGGIVPPFWIGEALGLGADALSSAAALGLGVGTSAALIAVLYFRARKRLG
ncbi:hypothetical protein [Pelagibacterium limicola]|uniref:hypothetical protein n=1 Tax=Pelagibacterium limicola TaxID=2791022 RepID=UPI0018AFE9EE|nr:hypothetical protein [Pelagibacterium limicola]